MNQNQNQVIKMLFLISQIGITMLVTVFLCIAIGMAVDNFFGTKLLVWFIVLGVISGFRSVFILVRGYIGDENGNKKDS
ncbi:MAG: AtpZ/AtpI family protein [Lachnospiraceae bacterium]|nr:AtpZ/AtpI family protein [Lachnospiraceae bacterium]MBQ8167057.1 AtpZ/AtpI family protein [Lachnospiraceae bacterium]